LHSKGFSPVKGVKTGQERVRTEAEDHRGHMLPSRPERISVPLGQHSLNRAS
jgi:hypothetical protein